MFQTKVYFEDNVIKQVSWLTYNVLQNLGTMDDQTGTHKPLCLRSLSQLLPIIRLFQIGKKVYCFQVLVRLYILVSLYFSILRRMLAKSCCMFSRRFSCLSLRASSELLEFSQQSRRARCSSSSPFMNSNCFSATFFLFAGC